jgi:formylglycine-generating enzyme required for sulfatase activity
MGKYEVTQAQWMAVMGNNPSYFRGENRPVEQVSWDIEHWVEWGVNPLDFPGGNRPVEWVSWNDVQSFITALKKATGRSFRLPSEAEWEYACRAGTTTRFYWGDDPAYTVGNDYAWWTYNTDLAVYDVGGKRPNAWGLYDMSGNVLEWCEDDWHDSYVDAPTDGRAWVDFPRGSGLVPRWGCWSYYGNNSRKGRIIRGGSRYDDDGNHCRSAYRYNGDPVNSRGDIGFRLSR